MKIIKKITKIENFLKTNDSDKLKVVFFESKEKFLENLKQTKQMIENNIEQISGLEEVEENLDNIIKFLRLIG